jgi:multidrug efflux pump subunit AcrA (membrane-fusion protein)
VFPNPDGSILPGTFAHLRLPIEEQPNALLVPERALGIDQTGQYVLVVSPDNMVEYRRVKSGSRVGDLCVVEGSLAPEDRVVVEGLLRARPKTKVTPIAETAPAVAETAALEGGTPARPASKP